MPNRRISEQSREVLRQLAEESQESLQQVLDKAIEMYRRQRFLEGCNRAYEALRAKPAAWKAVLAEREAWDATGTDGLAGE